MTFGEELKNEFDYLCKSLTGNVREETLFNQLVKAFENLGGNYKIKIIHGSRWCVDFEMLNSAGFFCGKSGFTRCELGDLLFVVVKGGQARLSIMQNKFDKKMKAYNDTFKAQMNQLYLLKMRPEFIYRSSKYEILRKANLPSIGNFGTFRKDGQLYDMGYYSSDCLKSRTEFKKARSQRKICLDDSSSKYTCVNKYIQTNFCENLVEFGNQLMDMKIGEPYYIKEAVKVLNNSDIFEILQRWDLPIECSIDKQKMSVTTRKIIVLNAN